MASRKIPLYLDDRNYKSWLFLMKSKLDRIGALGLVQGTMKPPAEADKPDEKNVYIELNRLAYHEIVEHLDDNNLTDLALNTFLDIEYQSPLATFIAEI